MSRILSELLDVTEALLADDLRRLELAGGLPSHDVRLTADIISKVRMKTKELGLDPADSTGREVYHALLNLVRLHDGFLVKHLGGSDPADVTDLLPRIRKAAMATKLPKTAWVMKHSVAKRLLKDCPPKRVMKYLGYKSLDSMLKRESIGELYGALQLLEDRKWQEGFVKKYHDLRQMDFETRKIEIIQLDNKRWNEAARQFIERQRHIIMHVRELGVILMLPPPFSQRTGLVITVLPQLLHHINEIRLYSAFYKIHQMRTDLGEVIARSVLNDEGNHLWLADQKIHWRVIQRHFGRGGNHPESLEPHIEPDDLSWRKAEAVLFGLEPALHFWHETDYIGAFQEGRPVSFNLMDMAVNFVNDLPYEQRVVSHFQDSLWNELFIRYIGQPSLEAQALKQLDYEDSAPQLLARTARRKP